MEVEGCLSRLRRFFVALNIFKTYQTDEQSLRIQRWSTRLYVPILFTAISILVVYTTYQIHSQQIQLQNPSLSTYLHFYDKYNNIKCPCTQIAVVYKNFLQISPIFHQVCSSDLTSEEWISFLYDKNKTTVRYQADFRSTAFSQFQILRELCQSSQTATNDGIETLYNSQLVSDELLNENIFLPTVEAGILAFQTITMLDFGRSLSLMRNFIIENGFFAAIQTAFTLSVGTDSAHNINYDDQTSFAE